jgi:type 1 glutamine amidotransferase
MKSRLQMLLLASAIAIFLLLSACGPAAETVARPAAPAEKVNVVLVWNGGHDGKGFATVTKELLEKTGDFSVTVAESQDELLPERIGRYHVVLFYGSGGEFTDPRQEQALHDFVRNGGGVVGVHATDAKKKSDVYWEILGGRFAGHGGGRFTVYIYDKEHPITAGLEDFEIQDETYSHHYHRNACMRCLVRMDRGNERQCMAWVSQIGKGRVFNTGLGHDSRAFANPQFQRLMVRGIYWAAGRSPKDP